MKPARTRITKLSWMAMLAICWGASLAQPIDDSFPYLLSRTTESAQPAAPGAGLETHVSAIEYALPGGPQLVETGARWSPVTDLTVRAGISSASVSPCPANTDCTWILTDPQNDVGFSVGASWQPLDSLEVAVDYAAGPGLDISGAIGEDPLNAFLLKEDLTLSCRLDTAGWGDLELGLKLSRWNDGVPVGGEEEASAAIGVAWELGSFRGDVTSRYMQMVGSEQSAWNTFDINIAWRTPWNARLSLGATNLLDTPAPPSGALDDGRVEDMLGRVPYVRYQQDL